MPLRGFFPGVLGTIKTNRVIQAQTQEMPMYVTSEVMGNQVR